MYKDELTQNALCHKNKHLAGHLAIWAPLTRPRAVAVFV